MTTPARIAAAPISWGVCEVSNWGYQMKASRVLEEMHELGFLATEAGPDGFLPDEPSALLDCLGASEMQLVGGFVPLVMHRTGDWLAAFGQAVERLARCGAEVLVLAAATGLQDYDARPELSAGEWSRLLAGLDLAVEVAAEMGIRAVLHPHMGTLVQSPQEIDRVLEGTRIPLCLDTGHILAGGGDPAAVALSAPGRVGHVHLKDVNVELAKEVASGAMTYSVAVRQGLYHCLGDGDVDVPAIVSSLQTARYTGWFVLEHDVVLAEEPAPGKGPLRAVERSLRYLTDVLAEVGSRNAGEPEKSSEVHSAPASRSIARDSTCRPVNE